MSAEQNVSFHNDARPPSGPLTGLRVLDLTHVLIGPYCTALLGDMGADVIKVEPPAGDQTRWVGPSRSDGMSSQFLNLNRNKRSVMLDLKQAKARDALLRLAETSDVFVCNMRHDALERLGLTYEDLAGVNPSIVYCRIVGFGERHPGRVRPSFDDVVQAETGLIDLQRQLTGTPSFIAVAIADEVSGLMAMNGILAALHRRSQTGEGDELEVAMYDVMSQFVLSTHLTGSIFEPPMGPPVYPRQVAANRRPWATSDGWLVVAPYTDGHWRRLLEFLGRSDLLEDPRFDNMQRRSAHLNELFGILEPLVAERTTEEWVTVLEEIDVAYGRVRSTSDLIEDETLQETGLLGIYEHSTEGSLRLVGNPIEFKNAPVSVQRLPPRLGIHSREVLAEAGYSDAEIDELVAAGATLSGPVGADGAVS
ncbi:MAG TPA: CoA transferase [Ilumatobacter sp.]|nr:CoA transferase [Ilumatobacter sp.]